MFVTKTASPPLAFLTADAGDKGGPVDRLVADADGIGLARNPCVADIDIVIARGSIPTGVTAQGNIGVAGCVVVERLETDGRVACPASLPYY